MLKKVILLLALCGIGYSPMQAAPYLDSLKSLFATKDSSLMIFAVPFTICTSLLLVAMVQKKSTQEKPDPRNELTDTGFISMIEESIEELSLECEPLIQLLNKLDYAIQANDKKAISKIVKKFKSVELKTSWHKAKDRIEAIKKSIIERLEHCMKTESIFSLYSLKTKIEILLNSVKKFQQIDRYSFLIAEKKISNCTTCHPSK